MVLKAVGEGGGETGEASEAVALVPRLRGPPTRRAAEALRRLDGCTDPSPSALTSSPAPSSATGADPCRLSLLPPDHHTATRLL